MRGEIIPIGRRQFNKMSKSHEVKSYEANSGKEKLPQTSPGPSVLSVDCYPPPLV